MKPVAQTQTRLSFFILLQCLDFLTTLVFIRMGVTEANPVVNWALSHAGGQWGGLIVTKLAAALIGQYCYKTGRTNILRVANLGYSLVVGWNLVAIIAAIVLHSK